MGAKAALLAFTDCDLCPALLGATWPAHGVPNRLVVAGE